jgi:hypothetical protein
MRMNGGVTVSPLRVLKQGKDRLTLNEFRRFHFLIAGMGSAQAHYVRFVFLHRIESTMFQSTRVLSRVKFASMGPS